VGTAFAVPSRESKNFAKLKDFLSSISSKSEQDEQAIEALKEQIKAVCKFDDFETFYDEMVRTSQGTGINSPLRYILKMISNHAKEHSTAG
jgi:rubrerythrin